MKSDKPLAERYMLVLQTSDNFYCCDPKGDTSVFTRTEDMIGWAKTRTSYPMLWFRHGDILALNISLPSSAEETEAAAAILFESASLSNRLPEDCAVSYIRANMLPCGNREELSTVFELGELKNTQDECRKAKIKFAGFAAVQQLLLLHHFSEELTKDSVLLYFAEDSAFMAQSSGKDITIRNLAFGIHGSANSTQWSQRAQRRLSMLEGQSVVLYVERRNEAFYQLILSLFKPQPLMMHAFEEILPIMGQFEHTLLHPAVPPPKKEDPRAPLTRLAIIAILALCGWLGFQWKILSDEVVSLEQQQREQQEIKQRISTAENRVKREEETLKKVKQERQMLENVEHFNREFIVPLNLLSRYSLRFTRINEVFQSGDALVMSGETLNQPDFLRFERHFTAELKKHGFSLTSEGLKRPDDKKAELNFRYTIKGGK